MGSTFAQADLNDYKYIIVPKKFDAFRNVNEHQTSTLIKYLFAGKGFNAVYDDSLPEDLKLNRCLGVVASLQDDSSMFTTKTIVNLIDCNAKTVYSSMQGSSKEKEYKEAYNIAIRESMRSFNNIDYAYNGTSSKSEPITVSFKNDVKKLDESKVEKESEVEQVKADVQPSNNAVVVEEATESTQYYKNNAPVDSSIKKAEKETPAFKKLEINKSIVNDIWYAQATSNGFQLVDSTPKIRMNLLKSSTDNVFMAKTDAKNGMVYQKDGSWIFEYYENDKLIQEELNIKF
ncbi:hypothetical protein A9200_15265 [Maribacter hydrothermalis]|uniref:Uncharacterized protein n=2 Tax=Maribacter hydrothermalis TaxID=1836467 RepID=A0A1B7ZC65_9FLAO|nr:hypothetical protein BTR34_11610 [Maribacter hydrothermalis]OBR40475.1 hypothetical protein A9200_15265 [Maribacter hydrothermalis]